MHSKITFLAFTSLFWVFSNLSAQSTIDVVKNKNDQFRIVEADLNTTPTHTKPDSGSITMVSSGNFHKFYYSPNKDFIGQLTLLSSVCYRETLPNLSFHPHSCLMN